LSGEQYFAGYSAIQGKATMLAVNGYLLAFQQVVMLASNVRKMLLDHLNMVDEWLSYAMVTFSTAWNAIDTSSQIRSVALYVMVKPSMCATLFVP
jgi:hypothetical protein